MGKELDIISSRSEFHFKVHQSLDCNQSLPLIIEFWVIWSANWRMLLYLRRYFCFICTVFSCHFVIRLFQTFYYRGSCWCMAEIRQWSGIAVLHFSMCSVYWITTNVTLKSECGFLKPNHVNMFPLCLSILRSLSINSSWQLVKCSIRSAICYEWVCEMKLYLMVHLFDSTCSSFRCFSF